MSPARRAALLAGLLYFSTHLTSVGAVIAYGAASRSGAGALASGTGRVLLGAALEVLLALGVLGTGVVLLPLLRPAAPIGAPAFAALRTLEAAVIGIGVLPMLLIVWDRADLDTAGANLVVDAHRAAFLVGQGLVISVTTTLIGAVLWQSGRAPAWIGLLGIAGGVLLTLGNIAQLGGWIAGQGGVAALIAAPAFAFEIAFAGYLVFRGLRSREPGTAQTVPAEVASISE